MVELVIEGEGVGAVTVQHEGEHGPVAAAVIGGRGERVARDPVAERVALGGHRLQPGGVGIERPGRILVRAVGDQRRQVAGGHQRGGIGSGAVGQRGGEVLLVHAVVFGLAGQDRDIVLNRIGEEAVGQAHQVAIRIPDDQQIGEIDFIDQTAARAKQFRVLSVGCETFAMVELIKDRQGRGAGSVAIVHDLELEHQSFIQRAVIGIGADHVCATFAHIVQRGYIVKGSAFGEQFIQHGIGIRVGKREADREIDTGTADAILKGDRRGGFPGRGIFVIASAERRGEVVLFQGFGCQVAAGGTVIFDDHLVADRLADRMFIAIGILHGQHRQQGAVEHGRRLVGAGIGRMGDGHVLRHAERAILADQDGDPHVVRPGNRAVVIRINTTDHDIDQVSATQIDGFDIQQYVPSVKVVEAGIGIGAGHVERPHRIIGCRSGSVGAPVGAGCADNRAWAKRPADEGAERGEDRRGRCVGLVVIIRPGRGIDQFGPILNAGGFVMGNGDAGIGDEGGRPVIVDDQAVTDRSGFDQALGGAHPAHVELAFERGDVETVIGFDFHGGRIVHEPLDRVLIVEPGDCRRMARDRNFDTWSVRAHGAVGIFLFHHRAVFVQHLHHVEVDRVVVAQGVVARVGAEVGIAGTAYIIVDI